MPEPLLLVGGQAVNLWALHYHDRTRDLAPFVSRDADVLGDRDTLIALGRQVGVKPQFFPIRPPSNEVGVVVAKDASGEPLLVEVLRYVHGATNEEMRAPVYLFALGESEVRVQVPGPIALFRAKIANLAELKQTGRQDGRHVLILVRVLPAYLADLGKSVLEGKLSERKFVNFLEQLLAVLVSNNGRKACADLRLPPQGVFGELATKGVPKVEAFVTQRLPRALARR
jgi:hypothetical protein